MASNADQPSSPDSSPGSAADALTPPTMKFASQASGANVTSGTENTIKVTQGPATGGAKTMPTTARTQASKTVSNITGDYTETLSAGIETQELVNDPLLLAAPRVDYKGTLVPCLNGIPMLAMIGRGGMGAVYYGVHPRLRSEVAVKVLPFHLAEQDQGMIRRFFREAQIAAQVRSPHLVNVMDVNEEAGLFFLVMEFVPGRTAGQYLKQCIEKSTPVTEANTLDLIIAATEGLWAAHAAGVIHRDIKPENIMVPYAGRTKDFELRRAKLMDLGLARSEESNQSLTGNQAAMGTPGYMAPEQAMDAKTADKRSDVFSMGATIYAMMYGKPPFRGETVMKILMATMHEPHEPLIKVRPDTSPVLNEIVERCLAKKQEHRFSDAKQLLNALEECKRLGASGHSGSIPTPGTFMYRPESGAQPGSSTNATQMGLPSSTGSGAQGGVKKGNKTLMIVGGGAAALLAAGIAFAVWPSKTPGMTDDQKKVAITRFDGDTKTLDEMLAKPQAEREALFGQMQIIANGLNEGERGQLASIDPAYKAKAEEYSKKVQAIQNFTELSKKVKVLDTLLNSQNLGKYKELEPEATKLATDAESIKILEVVRTKARKIEAQQLAELKAKDMASQIRKQLADGDLEQAQVEFAELKKLSPGHKEIEPLAKLLKELEDTTARKIEVAKKRDELKQLQDANDFQGVIRAAQALVGIDGARAAEYATIITDASGKLSDEQKKKQAEERTQLVGKRLQEAGESQAKGDLKKAADIVNGILLLDPKNEAAVLMKASIDKAIIDNERIETQRQQRARAEEFFTKIQRQLDEPNGDMDFAKTQLEFARKENPADLEIQKKADAFAEGIAKKALQQKNLREADEYVGKANLLIRETSLEKAREGEDLARKALALVPDHPGAKAAAAAFAKISADALRADAQKEDTHKKLIADGQARMDALQGKSLTDQIQQLEAAKRFFDDAKSMKADGPGAKLSTEADTKLKAVRDQYAVQKQVEGIVSKADTFASRGNFDEAVKALAALEPLDKETLKKKTDEYGAKKASADKVISDGLLKIAAKAGSGQIDSALYDAQTLQNANSTRTELNSVVSALSEASRISRSVSDEIRNFNDRLASKSARMKGTGAEQLAAANAQLNTYQSFVAARVKAYADGGFKDANFAQSLASEQLAQRATATNAVSVYYEMGEPRRPPDDPGIDGRPPKVEKKEEKKEQPKRRRGDDDPGIDGR